MGTIVHGIILICCATVLLFTGLILPTIYATHEISKPVAKLVIESNLVKDAINLSNYCTGRGEYSKWKQKIPYTASREEKMEYFHKYVHNTYRSKYDLDNKRPKEFSYNHLLMAAHLGFEPPILFKKWKDVPRAMYKMRKYIMQDQKNLLKQMLPEQKIRYNMRFLQKIPISMVPEFPTQSPSMGKEGKMGLLGRLRNMREYRLCEKFLIEIDPFSSME